MGYRPVLNPKFRLKYASELFGLKLPEQEYVIFGSGTLAERGIRENADIDILVSQKLWGELAKKYEVIDGCMQLSKHVEAYKEMSHVFDVDALIEDANIFSGIRFVRLQDLLAWKMKKDQEKDKKDVVLIKNFLAKRS